MMNEETVKQLKKHWGFAKVTRDGFDPNEALDDLRALITDDIALRTRVAELEGLLREAVQEWTAKYGDRRRSVGDRRRSVLARRIGAALNRKEEP